MRKSVSAFHLRARAWIAKDQPEKAIADLGEVLRLEPERADAYRMRGDLWRKQKNFEKAGGRLFPRAAAQPQRLRSLLLPGHCRCEKKEYEKAIADFNEVLCRQPEAIHAYEGRGLAWYAAARLRQGRGRLYREHPRCRTARPANWCRTAWSSVFQGDLRRAISCFAEFQDGLPPPRRRLSGSRTLPRRPGRSRQGPCRLQYRPCGSIPTRSAAITCAARTGASRSDSTWPWPISTPP